MEFSRELIVHKLRRWETYLAEYRLPRWEDIPDFGLYMEQVVDYLRQHLDYLPPEFKEGEFLTPATVNNYVRTKVMPKPVKKKYYRAHLAFLILILVLKQGMSIALIQKLLPADMEEEELKNRYLLYRQRHSKSGAYFITQVKAAAARLVNPADDSHFAVESADEMIVESAMIGGFTRILGEKLLLLEGKTMEEVLAAEPAVHTEQ